MFSSVLKFTLINALRLKLTPMFADFCSTNDRLRKRDHAYPCGHFVLGQPQLSHHDLQQALLRWGETRSHSGLLVPRHDEQLHTDSGSRLPSESITCSAGTNTID